MRLSFKVVSPANIALIKYWGQSDSAKVLPANKSLSFNLSECLTETTFTYGDFEEDSYFFEGKHDSNALEHVLRVRSFFAGKGVLLPFVKIESKNNFEHSSGLASSASAFSALTFGLFALSVRFGANVDRSDLVEMTRMSGSASAVRSLGDFFVSYDPDKEDVEDFDSDMDLVDVACVVSRTSKPISSKEGHKLATSSYFYNDRLESVEKRHGAAISALHASDLEALGKIIEAEALSFLLNHYSSNPPFQYLSQDSLDLIYAVKSSSIPAFFTFDAGSTVHFITLAEYSERLKEIVAGKCVNVYVNRPTAGTSLI